MTPRDDLMARLRWYERNLSEMLDAMRAVLAVLHRAEIRDDDAAAVLEVLRGRAP